MEKDLQKILGKRIASIVEQAGCLKYNVLLFPDTIIVRAEDARRVLIAAGDAIEAMFREAGIAGAQVSVQPNMGTIRVGFASIRLLDRSIQRAIDRGKL